MKGSKRQDAARLSAIIRILAEPFDDPEMDYLTTDTKLHYAFNPDAYPIYRRKVTKPLSVRGMWWMSDDQWVKFLWHGYEGVAFKGGQGFDKVLATRTFQAGWCYVRECENQIDLEALSAAPKWDPVKKKRIGTAWEWMTCSITMDEYKKLDSQLGPRDDGCKHTEGAYDFIIEEK